MTAKVPPQPRVKLYRRADATPAARRRQRAVRDRLAALAESGRVAGVETETWPRAVPLGTDADAAPLDPHAEALEAYATFESWAERAGVSLSPFFDRRERYTLDDPSAATRECLLPVVALTVHDGDEAAAAYPHTVDGDHRTVDDALAVLESGGGPSVDAGAGTGTGPGSDSGRRGTAD